MNKFVNRYFSTTPRHLLASIAAFIMLGATTSQAGPTYVVTDLGVLPGKKFSVSTGINEQGQVTGISSVGNLVGNAAFRYNNAGLEELNESASDNSRGFGINDFGVVAGDATFSSRDPLARHAALFSNGTVTDLGIMGAPGSYSRANAINSLGQVVGFAGPSLDSGASRAFIWTKSGGMQDIGTLGGSYAQAYAINDTAAITGNAQTSSSRKISATHAFFYQLPPNPHLLAGVMQDLGTLGGDLSTGTAINNKNHVVGYSTITSTDKRVHAFLHDGVRMRDLGTLIGPLPTRSSDTNDQSVALGVNTDDTVVGYTYLANRQGRAAQPQQVGFIYQNNVMTDLNSLITSTAQNLYVIYSATDINDNGQIAATAVMRANGELHAVLLTPADSRK